MNRIGSTDDFTFGSHSARYSAWAGIGDPLSSTSKDSAKHQTLLFNCVSS